MKFVDRGEFYSPKEDKQFFEAIPFTNESFSVGENKNTANEFININEIITDNNFSKSQNKKEKNLDREDIERLTNNQSVKNTNMASKSLIEASSVSLGASSSLIVTAAAVIISVVSNGSLFTNVGKYITNEVGNNYSLIEINIDKILKEDEKLYGLSTDDFLLRFYSEDEEKEIKLKDGSHKYLIPNLIPNTTYNYELVSLKNIVGEESKYYQKQFTTTNNSKPKGILDELNTYTTYVEDTKTYGLEYSVYMSDYYEEVAGATLFVTNEKQENVETISNVLDVNECLDEDNFFKGSINKLVNSNLYFYVVGFIDDEMQIISYDYLSLDITFDNVDTTFVVDESSLFEIVSPNKLNVSFNLLSIDDTKEFYSYIRTYDDNLEEISSFIETELNFNSDDNSVSLEGLLDYGTKYYSYAIYYFEEYSDQMNIVYQKEISPFIADQDTYFASFDKLSPNEVDLDYAQDSVTITADVNFYSPFDGYTYELLVVNDDGLVFGSYSGDGIAKITIPSTSGMNSINFIYNEYCLFNNENHLYDSYNQIGYQFIHPSIYIDNEISFDGTYFYFDYYCSMLFDYSLSSIEFIVIDIDDNLTYTYECNEVKPSSSLVLNQYDGEYGLVSIYASLSFVDNQLENNNKSINYYLGQFDLSYSFTVDKVEVDISSSSDSQAETVEGNIVSSYLLPSTYQMHIVSSDSLIDMYSSIDERISVSNIPLGVDMTLTISILDENNNVYLDNIEYSISTAGATDNYVPFYNYGVDYSEIVLTYNDDGTINIYRDVSFFSKEDYPNTDVNCLVYSRKIDEETGDSVCTNRYDSYITGKYSVLEDLPIDEMYTFENHVEFFYEGVTYIMAKDIPSGSINFNFLEYVTFEVEFTDDNQAILTFYNYYLLDIENAIEINGVTYTFDNYESNMEMEYTLTLSNYEEAINDVYIYVTKDDYYQKYDTYALDIVMKGNRYIKNKLTIDLG
ncbi:MAG: hypothetical protein ACI31G_00315 [Bacilli bacterium]